MRGVSWPSKHNTHLVVEEPSEDDKTIGVWMGRDLNASGQRVNLDAKAARELAAELVAQANHIDPLPKQSAGPVTVFKGDVRVMSSARLEAELVDGELALRLYPNANSTRWAVAIPIEDVRSVLAEIRDVAFPDERCPF
jgi:hypothetical protein